MNNIENKIKNIISNQFNISIDKIFNESYIKKDFEADSLDIVELIMSLEEEFKIEILDKDIEKLNTVKSIIDYIKNKINNNL